VSGYTPIPTSQTDLWLGAVSTGTMTTGSNAFTDDDGRFNFTSADVGLPIWIIGAAAPIGALPDNGMLRTYVATVIDSTHITTHDNALGDTSANSNATLFRKRGQPYINTGDLLTSLTAHDTFTVTFMDELPMPAVRQPVLFAVQGDLVFGGTIDNVVGLNVPGTPFAEWQLSCVGWDYLAYKRTTEELSVCGGSPVTCNPRDGVWTGKTVAQIMKDLIVYKLESEGLDFYANVDGPVIPTFTASYAACGDAFDQLIKAGSDDGTFLHWHTDPWKVIFLDDQSSSTAPWDVSDADPGSILSAVQCTWDRSEYVNRAIVRLGNEISAPVTETFVGDGATRTFQLTNPAGATPTITENGVLVSVGVQGIDTGSAWYWNQGSTAITQDPSGVTLTAATTLVVVVPELINATVAYENGAAALESEEIESGTGFYESVVQQDNPATQTDGLTLAQAIATQYGEIPRRIQITTLRPGLKIGQNIGVTLAMFGLSAAPFVIDSVEITTQDNTLLWTVTAVGSPLINWDYRATLATLRPGAGVGKPLIILAAPVGATPPQGEFSFQVENVNANPGVHVAVNDFSVDFTQKQRVNFCYTPQVIATTDLLVNVVISSDFGSTWTTLEALTIAVGSQKSWGTNPPPWTRNTPYSGSGPFRLLNGGDLLNFTVETGSAAGLTIKLDTNPNA
jgi:hypothetical protein